MAHQSHRLRAMFRLGSVNRLALLRLLAVLPACSPSPHVQHGGAALIYWQTQVMDLGECGGRRLLAALSPTSRVVEVLTYSAGLVTKTELAPPAGCRANPICIQGVDVDSDGRRDLLVMDPGPCGNWYARLELDCVLHSKNWGFVLPPVATVPWVSAMGTPAADVLSLAGLQDIRILTDAGTRPMWHESWTSGIIDGSTLTQLDIAWNGTPVPLKSGQVDIVFQRGARIRLFRLAVSGATIELATADDLPQLDVQDLRPFSAFDQLALREAPGGGLDGLALGQFPAEDGHVPRRLQHVAVGADGYRAVELSDGDGSALAVDYSLQHRFAAIENRNGQAWVLLGSVEDSDPKIIARQSAPEGYRSASGHNGMVIFGEPQAPEVTVLVQYDGSNVLTCTDTAAQLVCHLE